MYIHLGRDYVLNDRDIIGIFDLETTTISPRALYSWSVTVSAFVLVMISSAISFLPFVHFCVCFFKL